MELNFISNPLAFYVLLSLLSLILILNQKLKNSRTNAKLRPPGPSGFPILGNIFDFGKLPHQNLYKLRSKYGDLVWLRLGCTNTLVVQSAKAAQQLFKNHDVSFADRTINDAFTAHDYCQGSLAVSRYGPKWRILRRLVTLELMTGKKMSESINVRRKCIDEMIQLIDEDSSAARARGESGEIVFSKYIFVMAFNLMGNLMFSRDLVDSHSEEGSEFYDAMDKVMKWVGAPNLSDFFPFLKVFDPQRIKKNMVFELGRTINVVEKFMKERIEERKSRKESKTKDFLDSVLEFEGGDFKMSTHKMLTIILEMFLAGTETTSRTTEWAMTELLRSPESIKRVKEELNQVIGPKRKVEESHLVELPYLNAVIKETMRLHPVLPFLLPRNTIEETKFMGYVIPKYTQVFVNVWAIGRDSDSWEDPLSFKPERFLNSDINYKGHHFELIPFGSGRRICVGMALADRVVHLTLASLLHCFDWEIDSNSSPMALDMEEKMGITVAKCFPLKTTPKKIMAR